MSEHIPAWKRITIKKNHQRDSAEANGEEEDPLNITTHLATGSLTKKQKQKIIRGEDRETTTNLPSVKKVKSDKKKEKLPKEERDSRKQNVLKDQLRYLIDFYLTKVNSKNLPDSLSSLPNVKNNYSEKFNHHENQEKDDDDESQVVDVWKFSKQKQNWLIKHFFSVEEIPVEYDQLLLSYFKELKSPAIKDRVISGCKANADQWNNFIDKQDEKMRKIVEGEDDEEKEEEEKKEEDKKEEDKKDEKKEEEEELVAPDKRIVKRSHELLKLWEVEPLIELKRFDDDTL